MEEKNKMQPPSPPTPPDWLTPERHREVHEYEAKWLKYQQQKIEYELYYELHAQLRQEPINYLKKLGFKTHLKGGNYVAEAIRIALEDESYLDQMVTKRLYPEIAKRFGTSDTSVEHGIRTAISSAWKREGSEEKLLQDRYFPNGMPTNAEFIKTMVEELKK